MSPKEKAKELVDKYHYECRLDGAKRCALICVDEILNAVGQMPASVSTNFSRMFYREVKQEIEKL